MKKILVMLALMAVFSTTGFSAYTLSSVNIYNVSSAAPLYGHNMVICEAVLAGTSGASITVNIGLQYQNGTTGNWIYLNTSNTAINVSSTSGNPQSTKGTANFNKTFDVYTLVPGTGNQFRCNGTDGTNNKASSTSSMTILTPVLTVTDLSISPVNASSQDIDQNGLFNVTATVRCDNAGNASFPGSCGDVNATLYYNSTASYPNANVTMVGGPTFFTQNPDRPYQWFVGTGATKESILFGFDNNLNDTKSYADPTATGCAQCRFNYSFNSSLTSTTLVYTWTRGSAGPNYLQIYNYTSNSWQTISTSPITMTTESKTVSIANGFMSSAGTVKVSFGAGAGLTLNIYDVYLVNNNPNLGLANPSGYFSLPWGSDFTTTWQVNATRSTGNYWFNVTFNAGYLAQNNTGNFQINTPGAVADTTAPNIGSWAFNVSNMTNYSSTQGYNFNATVTDTTGISYVWLEQNFTGTLTNTTASSCGGNTYCYNVSSLAAGFYQIKWYANDSSSNHNLNNTDWVHYYQVNKSYLPLTLRINGTDGDKVLYNNSNANFTANFSSSYGFNITLYTNLTGSWAVWDNKASPLMNYTILNPYMARAYLIIANFSNQNYTYSQANHTLDLRNYGWLNISYQSPASGGSQNVYQNGTFNVTVNVTCVGGTCGNVTGVLRYNASAGLNPDTNISLTAGATPLFIPIVKKTNIYNNAIRIDSVAIGDPDNDGLPEFVSSGAPSCTKACSNRITVYSTTGSIYGDDTVDSDLSSGEFYSVVVGDADNNGKKEIVVGTSAGSNQVRMYVNETGQWIKYGIDTAVGDTVYSVAIGDADNDGYNEVVAGAGSSAKNETRMYKNVSSTWNEANISEVGKIVWSVAIGDADNDGQNEVVIGTDSGTNEVRMYNYSGGAWAETNIKDTPNSVYSVAIGDADNDGQNEVVIGMESTGVTNKVRMYKNVSGGWMETNISDGPDYGVYSVAIGDANNDGKNEVAIGIYTTVYEVRAYENVSGTWVETNISDGDGSIYGVAVGDVNGYGLNSVVVGGESPTSVSVLDIQSNPMSCGGMSAGQKCYLKWTVNATGPQDTQYWLDVNFTSDKVQVSANDSGDFQLLIVLPSVAGTLNATALMGNISVLKNRLFQVGTRVTCLGGGGAKCYDIDISLWHNMSYQYANTYLSETPGDTPFFVAGTYSESSRDDTYTILRMHMDNIGQDSGTMVYDETNRNNGTKLGDGSPAWSDGMFGSGLSFDGYNDYLNVSTVSSLNTYTKNLTIEFWFRPNKSTFANGDTILARNWDDTGNNSIWIFFWNNPGPKLHFQTITGGTVNDLEGTNSAWVPGKWYFIAATFNGSEADLYINATYDNSYNYVGGNIDKSDNILLIGAKNQWGGRINGTIDELVIFNRTKNNTEIGYDYNYNEHVYSSLMGNQYYKVVWTINATGNVLTDWLFESYVYSSNTSLADTDTNITVSIAPITGCGNYVNCAYPNCASYRDTTTTVQTTDARQKVWSTIRTCWS